MSLDVYLTKVGEGKKQPHAGIFIREAGQTLQISRAEWERRFPGQEPVTVERERDDTVYTANITHNLTRMATEAGIYQHLWEPEELGITKAAQLIHPLEAALMLLHAQPQRFIPHNPPNGWGTYDVFVPWVERYLEACKECPDADVSVWR